MAIWAQTVWKKKAKVERGIRTELDFNFCAFSINLWNVPQKEDTYLRMLMAESKEAITRKWQSKGIPSASEETEEFAGNVSRTGTNDIFMLQKIWKALEILETKN